MHAGTHTACMTCVCKLPHNGRGTNPLKLLKTICNPENQYTHITIWMRIIFIGICDMPPRETKNVCRHRRPGRHTQKSDPNTCGVRTSFYRAGQNRRSALELVTRRASKCASFLCVGLVRMGNLLGNGLDVRRQTTQGRLKRRGRDRRKRRTGTTAELQRRCVDDDADNKTTTSNTRNDSNTQ